MTRNDDFDRTLETWLRRQAPPQAPDRVLEAALQRAESESQRRSWLHRLAGGTPMTIMLRVATVAAVLAIAAFIGLQFSNLPDNIGASPTPIPSPSAEPSESAAPSVVPESAEPSVEPSTAGLVVRLLGGGEAGRVHVVTIVDDGRVITTDPNPAGGVDAPIERRLTAEGVQLIRDEMDATGLSFADSASYMPVGPGGESPPMGGAGPALEVGQPGGGTAVIAWVLFNDIDDLYDLEPQPEAEALEALATRLSTLEEWLPASAWADATGVPFEPERYRAWIYSQQWESSLDELPVEAATVAWPLVQGSDAFGDAVDGVAQESIEGSGPPRCRVVTAGEAVPVVEALEAAGAEPDVFSTFPGQAFALGSRETGRLVTITFESILPHAEASCGVEVGF
ncbi:MAG TPA: hypothetical protein VF365_01575 [Candidatus Limnocylindria bacterium]